MILLYYLAYFSVVGSLKENQAELYLKGREFQNFIERMFPGREFEFTHRADLDGSKLPDFHIKDRKTREGFWVEVKYRSRLFNDKFPICNKERLDSYKAFEASQKPEKVFMIFGLGGNAGDPEEIFCLPLDQIEFPDLFRSKFNQGKHDHATFRYERGRLY